MRQMIDRLCAGRTTRETDGQMLGEMGARQTIDRLICWEDNERNRDRQREVGGGRERQTDRC